MAKEKFNMEEAARKACEAFDREHGSEDDESKHDPDAIIGSSEPVYDAEGYAECPCGCGAKTHRDVLEQRKNDLAKSLVGQSIIAEIKSVPDSDKAGVVVSLPETKDQAYLLMLGIINTMSMAGGETFEQILAEVSRLNDMGAMSKGEKYDKH